MFFKKTGGTKFIFNSKSLFSVLAFLLVFNFSKASDLVVETKEKIKITENQENIEIENNLEEVQKENEDDQETIQTKKSLEEISNNKTEIVLSESDVLIGEDQEKSNKNNKVNKTTDQEDVEIREIESLDAEVTEKEEEDDFKIVINEIAWMGTTESYADEWIELKNLSKKTVSLDNWFLEIGSKKIKLEGDIDKGGFYLLERTDDNSALGVEADLIYTGNLNNDGEVLILRDSEDKIVNKIDAGEKWLAGNNDQKLTMERMEDGNWQNSFIVNGTPGKENSKENDGGIEENKGANKCNIKDRPGLEKILINEIFPNPIENESENEWIEIFNSGDKKIDLENCFLADGNYKPNEKNIEKAFKIGNGENVEGGKFKIFNRKEFSFGMNNSNEVIYFLDFEGNVLNEIFYEKSEEGFSYSLNSEGDWEWTEFLTSGDINRFPEPKIYSKKVEMTELMPNPEGVDKNKEWLELFNGDLLEIDLKDWYLVNQSDKKFKLDGLKIKPQERLNVKIINSSFSIKNSDGWIELRNPNGEKVDKLVYIESAKVNTSYNKKSNGKWEWSVFITPGQKNKFNSPPIYKVDIPDKIYKNVKVFFEIEKVRDKDGENLKFRWDFGDGKRSYLKKTSHKFDKRGRYTVQTRVSDLSVDVFKFFDIEVQRFPEFDLEIVKLLPNPKGSDSEGEKIWILNKEKKIINLKGWSITTGSSMSKLTNHYFKEDFKIKAGDTKEIDRKDCPFSLLNKKGRVVLKAPNGEVMDKVKYEKDKIEDDEIYYLDDDEWFWQLPIKKVDQQVKFSEAVVLGKENKTSKKDLVRLILDENKYDSSKKLVYFNNWLFAQSRNYFFEFIFPEILNKRVKSWK